MDNFNTWGLNESLVSALLKMQFTTPTAIQAQAIPHALLGKDILGSAQTGTGKTAAFGIPIVEKLSLSDDSTAIIITPTRELAVQVAKNMNELIGDNRDIKSALLIGGEPIFKQLKQLQKRPRLIVGTPGRITDHLKRKSLNLSKARHLVLDETDRMLDMGFSSQIDYIVKFLPQERQTMLFSATLSEEIIKLTQKYQNDPVRVSVAGQTLAVEKIQQETHHLKEDDKFEFLMAQLLERVGSVVIFIKTKFNTEKMAKKLRSQKVDAEAIHGDLRHNKRERVISDFRKDKFRVLVATDVAARGLDIPHIRHVINFDLPQCAEDYIHRIGRTARAGEDGFALNLVSPADRNKWHAIQKLLDPSFNAPAATGAPKRGRHKRRSFDARKSAFRGGSDFKRSRKPKEKESDFGASYSRDKKEASSKFAKKFSGNKPLNRKPKNSKPNFGDNKNNASSGQSRPSRTRLGLKKR